MTQVNLCIPSTEDVQAFFDHQPIDIDAKDADQVALRPPTNSDSWQDYNNRIGNLANYDILPTAQVIHYEHRPKVKRNKLITKYMKDTLEEINKPQVDNYDWATLNIPYEELGIEMDEEELDLLLKYEAAIIQSFNE